MVHPVQSVIESLYAAGRCPRLHVNATHDDVVCPDFIREQWKERLIIDLDASYPLDLTFGESGLAADLSFGGFVTRCEFPWAAIYIVADRATGRGIVLDRNMPESVRSMFQRARAAEPPASKGPELRPVAEVAQTPAEPPREESGPRPVAEPAAPEPAPAAAAEASPPSAQPAPAPATPAPATDEKQVQKRRAAFRVIDGGG